MPFFLLVSKPIRCLGLSLSFSVLRPPPHPFPYSRPYLALLSCQLRDFLSCPRTVILESKYHVFLLSLSLCWKTSSSNCPIKDVWEACMFLNPRRCDNTDVLPHTWLVSKQTSFYCILLSVLIICQNREIASQITQINSFSSKLKYRFNMQLFVFKSTEYCKHIYLCMILHSWKNTIL